MSADKRQDVGDEDINCEPDSDADPLTEHDRVVAAKPTNTDHFHTARCVHVQQAPEHRVKEATAELVTTHELQQCNHCIYIETEQVEALSHNVPSERRRSTMDSAEAADGYCYGVGQRIAIEYQTPHAPGNHQHVEGLIVAIRESDADDAPERTPEIVVDDGENEDRDLILRGDRNAVWSYSYASANRHQQRLGRLLDIEEIDGSGGDSA